MKPRTYLADSMEQAVAAVRRDLGSDAVILASRMVRRRGLLGFMAHRVVELRVATADEIRVARTNTVPPAATAVVEAGSREPASEVFRELGVIRTMVERVLDGQDVEGTCPKVPSELVDMYADLISQEVSEELAREVVDAVTSSLSVDELSNPETVRRTLVEQLAGFIPVSTGSLLSSSPDGRPLTLALVGPTGVGKTTTVAKIAAAYRIRQNRNVGLVTLDTYRIAAIDQLRTYAEIIGVPMAVARCASELTRALEDMADLDVILIDTAGRSQKDSARITELKALLEVARPHETHLVLAGTASRSVLLQEAAEFSRVGIDHVVLTKLDEAVSFGMLVEVVHRIGTRLSFLTTGQEVPDHIETARSDRLAAMVIGEGMPT